MIAEREYLDPANWSTPARTSGASVIDVFSFIFPLILPLILQTYYHKEEMGAPWGVDKESLSTYLTFYGSRIKIGIVPSWPVPLFAWWCGPLVFPLSFPLGVRRVSAGSGALRRGRPGCCRWTEWPAGIRSRRARAGRLRRRFSPAAGGSKLRSNEVRHRHSGIRDTRSPRTDNFFAERTPLRSGSAPANCSCSLRAPY